MNTSTIYDSQPWYRQFWPWFLISLPGSVVIAGFITLYIANRHADDLVAKDYYRDGLAINRQLGYKRRAEEQGISAELLFSRHSISVQMTGPVTAEELLLSLSHPMEADRDIAVTLIRIEPGMYASVAQQPITGRWHWTVTNPGDSPWRLDGSIDLGTAADALPKRDQ